MGTSLGAIGDAARPSFGARAGRLLVAVVVTVVASFLTTLAITSEGRDQYGAIAIVAGCIAAANLVLRPLLDWAAPAFRAVTTTLFLVLLNTAAFGIADRMATRDSQPQFAVGGFWEALAGGVMLVAVTIVLRRVLAFATRK